jgi:hypothetical protein
MTPCIVRLAISAAHSSSSRYSEQRSKRGIGRAQVEYRVGGKLKFDFNATKDPVRCLSQVCDHASLIGPTATIELGDEGKGTGRADATLLYTSESATGGFSTDPRFNPGQCSVTNSYSVHMTITVETAGDTVKASATSDPVTIQVCTANGQSERNVRVIVDPVSVPVDGGNNSATSGPNTSCLVESIGLAGVVDYTCKFTLTATTVPG